MSKTSCAQLIIASLVLMLMCESVCAQSGDSEHTHLPPPPPPLPPPPPPHSSGPMPGAIPPSVPPQNLESKLKDDRDSRDTEEIKQILSLTLPVVGVLGLILLVVCGVWYMLRQARYGALCCLEPNLNYYRVNDESYKDEQDEGDFPPPSSGIPPPDYSPTTIGPPVYQDALQDVILSSGTIGLEYLQPTATSSGLTSSTTAPVAIATAAAVASPPCNQLAAATTTTAEVMPAQGNHDGDGAGENSTEKKEEDTEHQDVTSCGVQQLI